MRSLLFAVSLFLLFSHRAAADEGLWVLPSSDGFEVAGMKEKGLLVPIEDICSADGGSLSDAVLIFGSGGTGAVVSGEGLVLTNHHCAYEHISGLSTPGNNILKNGFWAGGKGDELPVPGLSVTLVRRMEDITDKVLAGYVTAGKHDDPQERISVINRNTGRLLEEYRKAEPAREVAIVSIFEGNRFMLVVTETFSDIRLVGTPPEFIGKYGGERDNWRWPRHTGDFTLFRIYTAPDGTSSGYSPGNIPLSTSDFLTVSTQGYSAGDFTMTLGFPGYTERYLTPEEMEVKTACYGIIASIRKPLLRILESEMSKDESIRLKYASKYASISNACKYASGLEESMRLEVVQDRITARLAGYERILRKRGISGLLSDIERYSTGMGSVYAVQRYIVDFMYCGMDIFSIGRAAADIRRNNLLTDRSRGRLEAGLRKLYERYDPVVEKGIAREMLATLIGNVPEAYLPELLKYELIGDFAGNIVAYVDDLYDRSNFSNAEKCVDSWLGQDISWSDDPVLQLWSSLENALITVNDRLTGSDYFSYTIDRQKYMSILLENGCVLYPDANSTMRLSYGSVCGYVSGDGKEYGWYTDLQGLLDKSDSLPDNEYAISHSFRSLALNNRDFKVNFLTNNDIIGGNSGSPVLDAHGNLIGLVFDGNEESVSGYFDYDPETNRCICVDMRYVLFIIEQFAGAGYLLDEMCIAAQ
jgi:hypothetical protein